MDRLIYVHRNYNSFCIRFLWYARFLRSSISMSTDLIHVVQINWFEFDVNCLALSLCNCAKIKRQKRKSSSQITTYHMTLKFCLAMSSMNAQLFLCRPQARQLIIMLILDGNRRKIHNQIWCCIFWDATPFTGTMYFSWTQWILFPKNYSPHDHMDRQRLNTLYRAFHGFVAVGDFVSCDEMAAENMEAGNLIAVLDDACLKIVHLTLCKQIHENSFIFKAHSMQHGCHFWGTIQCFLLFRSNYTLLKSLFISCAYVFK